MNKTPSLGGFMNIWVSGYIEGPPKTSKVSFTRFYI